MNIEQKQKHIHDLITDWKLRDAHSALSEIGDLLTDNERILIERLLDEREAVLDKIAAIEDAIGRDPVYAVEQINLLPQIAQNHPEYDELVQKAKTASYEFRHNWALELLGSIKQAIEARQWNHAGDLIAEIKDRFHEWANDPIYGTLQVLEQKVETEKEIDDKLPVLDLALDNGDWSEAQVLLNELESLGVETVDLKPRQEKLQDLITRASGYSTREQYEDEIANLRAAITSLEGAKNWRAAYNNASKLAGLLQKANRSEDATEQSRRANEYLENLRAYVYATIDDRMGDAREALDRGQLEKARTLVDQAARTGDAPAPRPGQPVDVAGDIKPKSEQDKALVELLSDIEEKEEKRKLAKEHVDAAKGYLQEGTTIEGYRNALFEAEQARNIDESYPGLDNLIHQISETRKQFLSNEQYRLTALLQRRAERGDLEGVDECVDELRSLGLDTRQYDEKRNEIDLRLRQAEQLSTQFKMQFDEIQDSLNCEQLSDLEEVLDEWEQKVYSQTEIQQPRFQLDRFRQHCLELNRAFEAIRSGLKNRAMLAECQDQATFLATSMVAPRPAIARQLIAYWQAMAQEFENRGANVEYLRNAQEIALRTGDQDLIEEVQLVLDQALQKTKEGRYLSSLEAQLRNSLRQDGDLQRAFSLIEDLSKDDIAFSDPVISQLIFEIKRAVKRQRADRIISDAKQLRQEGSFEEAIRQLDNALQLQYSLEAKSLQDEIKQEFQRQCEQLGSLERVLAIDVSQLPLTKEDTDILVQGYTTAQGILSRQQPQPTLRQKCQDVITHYQNWVQKYQQEISKLRSEATNVKLSLEFQPVLEKLEQFDRSVLPPQLIEEIAGIERDLQTQKEMVQRVRKQFKIAEVFAARGEFLGAMRKIDRRDTNLPDGLVLERDELTEKWEGSVDILGRLEGKLPSLVLELDELLNDVTENIDKAKLARVSKEIHQFSEDAKKIDLAEEQPIRKQYDVMRQLISWLSMLLGLTQQRKLAIGRTPSEWQTTLEGQESEYRSLHSDGMKYDLTVGHLAQLVTARDVRLAWVNTRLDVCNSFIQSVGILIQAGTFPSIVGGQLTKRRRELTELGNLTTGESQDKTTLLGALSSKANTQRINLAFLLLGIVVTLFAGYYIFNRIQQPGEDNAPSVVVVTNTPLPPTQTPFIVVVTATPTPPTPSPTPTITPTPLPTATIPPTRVWDTRCVSTAGRWAFSEPGHTQSETEYHAFVLNSYDQVLVLRDKPDDSTLAEDWWKVRIIRGGEVYDGWILKDWVRGCVDY